MSMPLAKELELYGCDMDPDEFEDTLQEVFVVMFPSWSIEELERRPNHGVSYVMAVRRAIRCPSLEEDVIMRRLQNIRKKGRERKAG